jgi:RNA 3'-terminal phosphate cyclase (ATP)
VYLPLLLCGDRISRLHLTGGTHVKAAPCWEYLVWTWAKYLERIGGRIELHLARRGFFPAGGGRVAVQIAPGQTLTGLVLSEEANFTPHSPGEIRGLSFAAGGPPATRSPADIAADQAKAFSDTLASFGLCSQVKVQFEHAAKVGTYVGGLLPTSPVPTFHFALGERGLRADQVGVAAARHLVDHWQTAPQAVDAHAADQLLLPLVFASGPSRFPVVAITQHLLTNADVIGHFLDRPIRITGALGQPGWVEISG